MVLPTFLGIGVPRAGTTWLHGLLDSHPHVFVPSRRKELFFFDEQYDRGLDWYQKFFPSNADAARYQAIGEITPFYLYHPQCPERISRLSVPKLLLMLRNPVNRAWSYYAHMVQIGAFWGSFEDFLTQAERESPVVEQGYYGRYLRNYLQYFDRDQILILIYEHTVTDIPSTKRRVAEFLNIAADQFHPAAGEDVVNASYMPRARRAYSVAFQISRMLRNRDLDWIVNTAKRLGAKRAFGVAGNVLPMAEHTREHLRELFQPEIDELEKLLGIPLDVWR
jgi:hypothetical protein